MLTPSKQRRVSLAACTATTKSAFCVEASLKASVLDLPTLLDITQLASLLRQIIVLGTVLAVQTRCPALLHTASSPAAFLRASKLRKVMTVCGLQQANSRQQTHTYSD